MRFLPPRSARSAALLATLFPASLATADAGVIVREPYLQAATSSSIPIAWRTARPISPEVRYARTRRRKP
jgi:hypothetical protein